MAFVDTQGVGRGDADLPELILKVYNSAKCHMDPDKWLQQCVDHAAVGSFTDAGETVWGKYLIGQLFACIDGNLAPMKKMADTCAVTRGLQKTEAILRQIIDQMEDPLDRTLLRYHYLCGKTQEQMAEELHYCDGRYIRTLLDKALVRLPVRGWERDVQWM